MPRKKKETISIKKQIIILGFGPGNPNLLTGEAISALTEAQLIIGSRRTRESLPKEIKVPYLTSVEPVEIASIIDASDYTKVVVCMSGDSGFYSGTRGLIDLIKDRYHVYVLPGISSISYLGARAGIAWNDAAIVSNHGRNENWISQVKRNEKTFVLMGKTPAEMLGRLVISDLGHATVIIGYMLSYSEERIITGKAAELVNSKEIESMTNLLTCMFVLNPKACKSPYTGIPDEEFIRSRVPMTKSEVRAVSISKMAIKPDDICVDVGAGTGSVSIEMASLAYRGQVYSIERSSQAIKLLSQNKEKFCADNMNIVTGEAAAVLDDLPAFDVAFIGGSRGQKKKILSTLLSKNPNIKIVMNVIALESLADMLKMVRDLELTDLEISQVNVARSNETKGLHLMEAQNPIYVLSCRGNGLYKVEA